MPTLDVIVVGGGGSGLAAAASAAECGARVLLLEKQPQLGGTTGIAVGSFTACGTRLQHAAGIDDDPTAHAEDAARFAPAEIESRNVADLRRFFLSQAAETLDWLAGLGLGFHGPHPEPPNRVPRMHNVVPGAKAYIAALHARLVRCGGEVVTRAEVVGLLWEDAPRDRKANAETSVACDATDPHPGPLPEGEGAMRRVGGVAAMVEGSRVEFRARRGVILAAGDYANSPQTIARFKGDRFADIEGINPHATGDGHKLAEQAGARLVNMDVTYGPEIRFLPPPRRTFQQLLPVRGPLAWFLVRLLPHVPRALMQLLIRRLLVTWQHPENALFDDGATLINARGERFCDATVWPDREIAIARQPGKVCYILLDGRLSERYSRWPHFVSTAPKIAYAYVADYLRLRPDVAVEAATLAELAARRNLPAASLAQAVADHNREASVSGRQPLGGNRWVLLGPAKAYFTTTEGGAAISQNFEVLDEHSRPIPGLYAVGQNGLGGQILWGHGLHIAWAITSGRLAGRLLASDA